MNIAALKCKTLVRQFHHIVDAIGNEAGISYVVNAKLKEENPCPVCWALLANGLAFSFGKQGGKSSARQWARIFLRKTKGGLEREKICT